MCLTLEPLLGSAPDAKPFPQPDDQCLTPPLTWLASKPEANSALLPGGGTPALPSRHVPLRRTNTCRL